jgi:DNA helicase-2/ATP-dependent DNA helicase PcrA
LNAGQRHAVEAWDECLLVMAPVGTGKTSALAWRAANAIAHGVRARSVLCLSFTNKASRQMRERAAAVLGEDAALITARTFHSLCALILRGDAGALGLDRDFLVFDDEDARSTACEIAVRMGVVADKRERLGFFLSNALQEIRLAPFGSHAPRGQDELFEDIRDKSAPPGFNAPTTFRFAKLHAEYVHALRESHAIDFADLVIGVNRLWQESE